ncbi:restriction endonuclease subunit S [Pseudanabaena yagii]|uniref:Restriction endonuclease n=1 Tax=Pseudanabaena yagii GIHE-NHR1 TaxID=2722753 RepID=A0ABX1LWC0_9CYAN|nr:restriction endonuclease subunit S [Pseudanabaena yagii]NMF58152.1 restriction endonuclease [Pseudanabaena yagii GIHE-NHR1]
MKSNKSLPLSEAYWFQEGPGVRKWQFTDSGIKLLNVGNIEKNGTLNLEKTDRHLSKEEVAQKYSHFLVDEGDLVIASSGISFDDDGLLRTRGAFVEKHQLPLCLNTSTIRFKAVEGISELSFLRFWLDSREFRSQITKLVTGSAQQNFGPSHLKAIKIKLPPIAEQKRIAEILDRTQSLISKRKEAIAKLDTLTQSIFLEMFGDPVINPKGWNEDKTLGEVADIVSGITKGRKLNGQSVREVPYLAVVNVQDHKLDLSVIKTIEAKEDEIERYRLQVNDLVLTEGGDPDKLGRGTIWHGELPECIHQNHIFRVRIKLNELHPRFLMWLIGSKRGKSYFLKSAKQTTGIASINMTQLKGFPVLIPPLQLQKEFAQRVEAVEKLKATHRASLSQLEALFASLQHRAFRGEL